MLIVEDQFIAILGAGESGVGAALLAKAKKVSVFVSDAGIINNVYKAQLQAEGIPFEEGGHTEHLILKAKEVIKSPGIPHKAPIVQQILSAGIPIIDELEFAARYTDAKFIAITGSNGKTTTTLLTYHLLKEAGFNVGLAGNIGYSLAAQVIEDKFSWYVLEVSSFQLDGMNSFRAEISVLLNITPDHLDRYDYKFTNYAKTKFKILNNQSSTQYFISNLGSEAVQNLWPEYQSASAVTPIWLDTEPKAGTSCWLDAEGLLQFRIPGKMGFSFNSILLPILGLHNYFNTLAAVTAAVLAGANPADAVMALPKFINAPHRLQLFATIKGVDYVNDSKATNVDSVKFALSSFAKPVVLILGGVDKGNDYSEIAVEVLAKCKALVFMGKDNTPLLKYFKDSGIPFKDCDNLEEAILASAGFANSGDAVLLSPACASFDLFRNYIDRGDQFMDKVKALLSV